MKEFPLERIQQAAKKFDAGWEKGEAPFEYWAIYLEAAYVEGARTGWALGREGLAVVPVKKAKKKVAKKKTAKRVKK